MTARPRRMPVPPPTPGRPATPEGPPIEDIAEEPESGPLRRCIVTREQGERARMVRFVVGPDRAVLPDLLARLPGRGMWLSARRDVLEAARGRGVFARAAKGQVIVPPDLVALVEAGLTRRVVELLGLARRAGQAVSGFQKAREWLAAGRVGLVLHARDGSVDERERFLSGARSVPVAEPLLASELGAAFGRDAAVHVAVAAGRLASSLSVETGRLAGVSGRMVTKRAGDADPTHDEIAGGLAVRMVDEVVGR